MIFLLAVIFQIHIIINSNRAIPPNQRFEMKGHYEKQLTASWIQERLKPTHYGVLTLKQGCWVENGDCDSWVKGTRDQFAAEYGEFVKNLTVEFKGRTNFRRHKKLLPNAATLEGDGLGCLSGSWHSPSSRTFLSGSRNTLKS